MDRDGTEMVVSPSPFPRSIWLALVGQELVAFDFLMSWVVGPALAVAAQFGTESLPVVQDLAPLARAPAVID